MTSIEDETAPYIVSSSDQLTLHGINRKSSTSLLADYYYS